MICPPPPVRTAHRKTFVFFDRATLMKTLPACRGKKIPETLGELKAEKRRLLQETFGEIEKAFLVKALHESGGNITRAAARVGMQRSNFSSLMKKHCLFIKDIMPRC